MRQRAGKSKASCRRQADAVEQRHEETCTVSIVLGQWFNSTGWIREHLIEIARTSIAQGQEGSVFLVETY